MDSEAVREIVLRSQTLTLKLQEYDPYDIDEIDVDKKVYLAKIEEIDHILDDISGKVNKYLYKFPGTERSQYLEDLRKKALSDVISYRSLLNAKAWEIKKAMTLIKTTPLDHAESRNESDLRRRVEELERANVLAEAKLKAAEARKIEKENSLPNSKPVNENLKIVTELDEKTVTEG